MSYWQVGNLLSTLPGVLFVARVPKSPNIRLVARAEHECVSMNTYLVLVLAQSMGAHG